MSIGVIVEIRYKPGSGGPAWTIQTMGERLQGVTRSYDGCEHIYMYVDPEDPDRIVLVERWESREKYERYREWAMAQPGTQEMMEMMEPDGLTTRYLDDSGV